MEVVDNYLKYRNEKPSYASWKEKRDIDGAKKLNYIKANPLSEAQKQEYTKRAKAVLGAVDIMDEYSQTRAEDMELAMSGIKGAITYPVTYLGMALGGAIGWLVQNGKNKEISADKKFTSIMMSAMIGASALSTISGAAMAIKSAKNETQASRKARFEAMKNDLSNPNHFAVLTDEQEKQVEDIAKDIKISKKEQKKKIQGQRGNIFGAFAAFKEMGADVEYIKQRKEFDKQVEGDKSKFDTVQLSQEQIEEAKKDKQLIQEVVEEIDVASQSYAEDVELATQSLSALSIGSGALGACAGFGIAKLLKCSKDKIPLIAAIAGIVSAIPISVFATKIQKQASRVARWKVKQDFLKNPEKLYYVDEEKFKNENVDKNKKEQKLGYFAKLKQIFDDNKAYEKWEKEEEIKQKQRQKALDKIEITPAQEKRAKQLQNNVFKMFNKVDEKSQVFSESTEALSEIIETIVSGISAIAMEAIMLGAFSKQRNEKEMLLKTGLSVLLISIPTVLINIFATKEQKHASKVADMLAIKEMDDYRNFADYSNDTVTLSTNANSNKEQEKTQIQNDFPWIKKN